MNTPHDHDHNDMTPLDYALAHGKQLSEQLEEATKDRDLWKAEAKRWRDMYMEYDEMLEGQVNDVVDRLEKVWEGLDELKKQVEDEY